MPLTFPTGRKRRAYKMVMGYFDESEDSHAENVFMSGYLADDSVWESLTASWNVLLQKHGIPYLHLADFIAARGIYAELGWGIGEKFRSVSVVLDDFIEVMVRHNLFGFGVGLHALTYRQILRDVRKKEKPEVFCFERILRLVTSRLDALNWSEPVCLVFDDSESYSMKAYANLSEIRRFHPDLHKRICGIAFGKDECFAPLQAADLLAYATQRMSDLGEDAWNKHPNFRKLMFTESSAFGRMFNSEHWTAAELKDRKNELIRVGNRRVQYRRSK